MKFTPQTSERDGELAPLRVDAYLLSAYLPGCILAGREIKNDNEQPDSNGRGETKDKAGSKGESPAKHPW